MPNEKHCVLCGGTGHSSHQCPWTKKAVKPTEKRKEKALVTLVTTSGAIQLTILAYGILQDVSLSYLRSVLCP